MELHFKVIRKDFIMPLYVILKPIIEYTACPFVENGRKIQMTQINRFMIKSRLSTTENRIPAAKTEIIENINTGSTAIQLLDTATVQEINIVNSILQRGSK
jgi:hypothetical protein